ncbi:UvrABC system protein A [Streptomyces griseoloalbus]
MPFVKRRHSEAESDASRERFEGYMREVPCPSCEGTRLKPVVLAVTVMGKSIAEVSAMSISDCADFLGELKLTARDKKIAERVLKEVNERLRFLVDVGLDYLSLNRAAGTLPAARPSASAWPPRSAAASSACSTCSTSPPSACTSGTTTG